MACDFCLQETASEKVIRIRADLAHVKEELRVSQRECMRLEGTEKVRTAECSRLYDALQERNRDLAREKREKLEWMSSSAKALAGLEAARAETARLRERVEAAIDYANGRWSEWGERAETVRDMLEQALTSDPEP